MVLRRVCCALIGLILLGGCGSGTPPIKDVKTLYDNVVLHKTDGLIRVVDVSKLNGWSSGDGGRPSYTMQSELTLEYAEACYSQREASDPPAQVGGRTKGVAIDPNIRDAHLSRATPSVSTELVPPLILRTDQFQQLRPEEEPEYVSQAAGSQYHFRGELTWLMSDNGWVPQMPTVSDESVVAHEGDIASESVLEFLRDDWSRGLRSSNYNRDNWNPDNSAYRLADVHEVGRQHSWKGGHVVHVQFEVSFLCLQDNYYSPKKGFNASPLCWKWQIDEAEERRELEAKGWQYVPTGTTLTFPGILRVRYDERSDDWDPTGGETDTKGQAPGL